MQLQCPTKRTSEPSLTNKATYTIQLGQKLAQKSFQDSRLDETIVATLCSMHYVTFDEAVQKVVASGPGARLAKIDVEQAYQNFPVHPEDCYLLGMAWEGEVYVDAQLPFELRPAPMIFSAIADALEWIVYDREISYCMHYLDDFSMVGPAESDFCERNLDILKSMCKDLGVPLKLGKVEGQATTLVFLGIQLDTVTGVMSLPQRKLEQYKTELLDW